MQKEELYERAQVLQKSRTAEKYLRSSLKTEQECFEQTVLEKQAAGDPLALLCKQWEQYLIAALSLSPMRRRCQRKKKADLRGQLRKHMLKKAAFMLKWSSWNHKWRIWRSRRASSSRQKQSWKSQSLKWRDWTRGARDGVWEAPEWSGGVTSPAQRNSRKWRGWLGLRQGTLQWGNTAMVSIIQNKIRNFKLQQGVDQISSALTKGRPHVRGTVLSSGKLWRKKAGSICSSPESSAQTLKLWEF